VSGGLVHHRKWAGEVPSAEAVLYPKISRLLRLVEWSAVPSEVLFALLPPFPACPCQQSTGCCQLGGVRSPIVVNELQPHPQPWLVGSPNHNRYYDRRYTHVAARGCIHRGWSHKKIRLSQRLQTCRHFQDCFYSINLTLGQPLWRCFPSVLLGRREHRFSKYLVF
jgi:hypothetical protein